MNRYTLWNFDEEKVDWERIESLHIDIFPWYQKGKKQGTVVKMALSHQNICLQVECEDAHSFAQITEFNGSVYQDSCFEFFLTPNEARGTTYFNFEINCCKTLHLAYGEALEGRQLATLEQGKRIKITSSIAGSTKEEHEEDQNWYLFIEIPIKLLSEMSDVPVSDTLWFGNFYRCGGKTDPQYASWQRIESELPAFHRPEQFGELRIKDWRNNEVPIQYEAFDRKNLSLVEDIYGLWNAIFGENYPIQEQLILQNSFFDPDILEDASLICKNEEGLLGILICKHLQEGSISGYEHVGFINLLLVKAIDKQASIYKELLDRAFDKMKAKGIKRVHLYGDLNNYFPGVPTQAFSYLKVMKDNGFQLDHIVSDLYKRYPKHTREEIHYPEGISSVLLCKERLEEFLSFMREAFPGRWAYEVEKYIEAGGDGREFVLLQKERTIIGFCRINDQHSPMIWYNMNFNKRYENGGGVGPLGVSEHYRGMGLGKTVTQAGVNVLLDRGLNEIIIDWTDLEAFYEKIGYNVVDRFHTMTINLVEEALL